MKLYKIFFAGAICLLGSCTLDNEFLEEKPKDLITIENAFNNGDQVTSVVYSAYYLFQANYFSTNFGGSDPYAYKQVGTDIRDGKFQTTHFSNFTTSWSATQDFVKTVWDNYYKIIADCNLALAQMDNVTWTNEEDKARVTAEAKFLRGLAHLRLAEYYGAVPLIQEFSDVTRFDYVRTPRATVYEAAIADMLEGYNNALPESTVALGDASRASKYAAAMFLAEAYLALGVESGDNSNYTLAAQYAQEVIDHHPLMTSRFGVRLPGASGSRNGVPTAFPEGNVYSDLFVSENMSNMENTESIWLATTAPDYTTFTANASKGYVTSTLGLGPSLMDLHLTVDGDAGKPWAENISAKYGGLVSPFIHGGTCWAQIPATWFTSVTAWDAEHNFNTSQDYRFTEGVTVRTKFLVINEKHPLYEQYAGWEELDKQAVNEGSTFFPLFYKEVPLDGWDWDEVNTANSFVIPRTALYRNKYIARSAEAYLLLAEAQYRNGDTGTALATLNTLRARSNANPATHIDIQVILDERARELMCEEDRWGTLLRMNPNEWRPRIYNYGMYSARSGDTVYPEVRRWAEFPGEITFKNWPIPQTYRDLNTDAPMEQNEGW